jgi:glycosyltransferase involved in cell wall biosynthesis
MRICWLLPDDYSGGIFPVVSSACRHSRKAGHDATLLVVCPPAGNYEAREAEFVHSLNLPPKAPETPERLVSWLSDHGTEALVLNGCEEADPVIPYLPEPVRCIYAIHDTARWYWREAVRFQQAIDAIVAVSELVARAVQPHLADSGKLSIIPNGSSYPPAPGPRESRADDLLFVGGDDPMKGGGDAVRVWTALQRRGFKGCLHWCGHANAGFVRSLDRLPGRERLVLHGRIPRAGVFDLARRSRVFLALTRAESFGMATVEAMSMGCVPVAWEIETGAQTLVRPNVRGFFAPLGNYEAFASAVLKAIDQRSHLSSAAILRARTEFTQEAMWSGYEQVIRRCGVNRKALRPLAGNKPPRFQARLRLSRILPAWIWKRARALVTNNPWLAYLLRDLRRI